MGLEKLMAGFRHGYGYKDHRSSTYGFEEHKEFVSHEESKRGFSDHRARYDSHMRLPANHGPPMGHMAVWDDEDSDSDVGEFFQSSRSHHTTVLPHHGINHHQQPPHLNFMPPPPMAQPHHQVKMSTGWQQQHGDAYHGTHGVQQHGAHGMQNYGHQDRLMAPHIPPNHAYMNPISSSGSHHKAGWVRKGL